VVGALGVARHKRRAIMSDDLMPLPWNKVICLFCQQLYDRQIKGDAAQVMLAHIKVCDKHPLAETLRENEELETQLEQARIEIAKLKKKLNKAPEDYVGELAPVDPVLHIHTTLGATEIDFHPLYLAALEEVVPWERRSTPDGRQEAWDSFLGKIQNVQNVLTAALPDRTMAYEDQIKELEKRCKRFGQWVVDLQSGMYINCVYCGHRYGPKESTPIAMSEVLYEHIKICPEHPLSAALEKIEAVKKERQSVEDRIFGELKKEREALNAKMNGAVLSIDQIGPAKMALLTKIELAIADILYSPVVKPVPCVDTMTKPEFVGKLPPRKEFMAGECMHVHDNISMLIGVPEMPIEDLPKVCTCGAALTYADEVAFVDFSQGIKSVPGVVEVKEIEIDFQPAKIEDLEDEDE